MKKTYTPPVDIKTAEQWARKKVAQMTLEEKVSMIGGREAFYTEEIPRLDIPKVLFADASMGLNFRTEFQDFTYDVAIDKSTAMPCKLLLAATWNKGLAYDYAKAVGEECRGNATPVLLGPGMNIYRHSQCGRNFEYVGEDPYLASRIIENYVVGLQNTGTIATLKHFIANNTDYFRRKSNSIVDERTLHEIYMPAFKAGIEAGAMAVMTSYNLVNGQWAGQSDYVINHLLRKKLGFQWLVMTDWWSVYNGEKVIKSGQDLEMPANEAVLNAEELVREGKVNESDIDRMVVSILKTLYAMQAFDRKPDKEMIEKIDDHAKTVVEIAREGIVLLKNKNNILPLKNQSTVLLTGPYADKVAEGGGAATVKGYDQVPLNRAIEAELGDTVVYTPKPTDDQIKNASVVLLSIGTFDSEGWDRPFELPETMEELVHHVADLNPNTIVIVNSGSGIKMTNWQDKVAAIIYGWYPGQNGNIATAEIISGKTNPSGKLPITIEKDFADSPGADYLPAGEDLYSDWNDEEEKKREVYDLPYREGNLVGYRWYDTKNIEPLFPFGHGLSYSNFKYRNLKIDKAEFTAEDKVNVTFDLTNDSTVAGAEIAQLYVSDKKSSLPRPVKELKGFEKVRLAPGETKSVAITLDKKAFSFFDDSKDKWIAEPGEFDILIGSSSRDIRLQETIVLK